MTEIYIPMNEIMARGIYEKAFLKCLSVWRNEKPEATRSSCFEPHSYLLAQRVLNRSSKVVTAVKYFLPSVEVYTTYVARVEEALREEYRRDLTVHEKVEAVASWWHSYDDCQLDAATFFGYANALDFSSSSDPSMWRRIIEQLFKDLSIGPCVFTPRVFEGINTLASVVRIGSVDKLDLRVLAAAKATVGNAKKLKHSTFMFMTREDVVQLFCKYFGFNPDDIRPVSK